MKRTGIVLLAVVMVVSIAGAAVSAAGLTFTDNFSSGNLSKWTNLAIEQGDKADTECAGKATVSNNTLNIKNFDPVGSFFYLAPKNIKTKNFTVSMKVKSNSIHDGWVGFSVRKETNDRYNGSNNILLTYRLNEEGSWFDANRGYAGSIASLTSKITEKTSFTGNLTQYHVFKLVVKDTLFTGYIDDVKVGVLTYTKLATAGYISINACLADISIQDFKLETEDGVIDGVSSTSSSSSSSKSSSVSAGSKSSTAVSSTTSTGTQSTVSSSDGISNGKSTAESLSNDSNTSSSDESASTAISSAESTNSSASSSASTSGSDTPKSPVLPIVIAVAAVAVIGGGIYIYIKKIKK